MEPTYPASGQSVRFRGFVRVVLPLALAVTGLFCAGSPPSTVEWPQWRGPARDGLSSETGLIRRWPEGGPRLAWKATNVGVGISSLAISDGLVVTMGNRGEDEYVVAFDVETGSEVWSHRSGDGYTNSMGDGPRSTPTIDGARLYSFGASGDLWCLERATGRPLWHVNILERFRVENLRWGLSESPLVDEQHVYLLTGSRDGSVVAFDKLTGEILWQSRGLVDPPSYASGIVVEVDGVRQLVFHTAQAAIGMRAADGKKLWRYGGASNDTANCTTPLVRDNHLFLTSGYDAGAALIRLTSTRSGTTVQEVYRTPNISNQHGGVLLVGDEVYGFSSKVLTCIDFETGERRWRSRSVGKGSLTYADGMLYVLSKKGVVALVHASPKGYREVSRFELELRGRHTWAHPVVAGGRLYLRNEDELLGFDIRTPQLDPQFEQLANAKDLVRWGEHVEGLTLLRPLADREHPEAMNLLGALLLQGEGVKADPGEAVRLFRASAERGFVRSLYNLGVCSFQGIGLDRDPLQAHKWFTLAGKFGVEQADEGARASAEILTAEQILEATRLAEREESAYRPAAPGAGGSP